MKKVFLLVTLIAFANVNAVSSIENQKELEIVQNYADCISFGNKISGVTDRYNQVWKACHELCAKVSIR